MKKILQGLFILLIAFSLTACSKGLSPVSIGNLYFNYDTKVWTHIKTTDNAPALFKDKNDNKLSFNVSQESTYQHPVAMISFLESLISDSNDFEVYLEPSEITVNGTTWYEYGYIYNDGSTTYKVYQRYYGKYYNAASITYTSSLDLFDSGYDEAIKLMSDIKVEEVSNEENEAKAKEFLVGEWDLKGKGYLVISENNTYEWFIDSSKDMNNMHYGSYGCDVENANMNLSSGDGLYLVLFPECLIIDGITDTSLQVKNDYIISLMDDASEGYPMVNISNYTLYSMTRQQ